MKNDHNSSTQGGTQSHHADIRKDLLRQIGLFDELRKVAFDDPSYNEWRRQTGTILGRLFGDVQGEPHPCTQAFLSYRIPDHFAATREEMRQFYLNILDYQQDLLTMYLENIEE